MEEMGKTNLTVFFGQLSEPGQIMNGSDVILYFDLFLDLWRHSEPYYDSFETEFQDASNES